MNKGNKQLYALMSLTLLFTAACNNSRSANTATIHLSAYAPSGHLTATIRTRRSAILYKTRSGNTALDIDTVVRAGERIQISISGPPQSSLTAYAAANGVVTARKETMPSGRDSAKIKLTFDAN